MWAPLICAELKNSCENTKTILPPTTAIATKRSVAITGATALLEVNLYFDCSFIISEFLRIEKGVKGTSNSGEEVSFSCSQ